MRAKKALISVYNKEGVVELAKVLSEKFGYEIISTGGTFKKLAENGINCQEISDLNEFGELLNGRVKTLHPRVFAGILAQQDNSEHLNQLEKFSISPVDLVIVNLYPFKNNLNIDEMIELIDIGGVSLIRAAAKNFDYVASVCSVFQYEELVENLEQNDGVTSIDFRKKLAVEAFAHTAAYDTMISNSLSEVLLPSSDKLPEVFNISLKKEYDLRYGENPHQAAAFYSNKTSFDILNGKELSFNNINDMSAAVDIISEFPDVPAVAVIKHSTPCGVAIGNDIDDAYMKAFDCDSLSAFGGIIAFNQPVTEKIAKHASSVFLEVLVAPDFSPEALELLKKKKNLRLIKLNNNLIQYRQLKKFDIKELSFGTLIQSEDRAELNKDTFKVVTEKKPTAEQVEDMVFAWKVAKHAKSNAIVVAKDKKAIGIGAGQTSRIGAMEIALSKVCDDLKDAVVASDGFFPAIDNIKAAASAGITAIIQPGGSIKDKDVIDEANKYKIAMITTSIRHFKH